MYSKIICFVAFICTTTCNPLGQTTICETGNLHPNYLPTLGGATVCESTPNLIYPYGFGAVVDPGLLGMGYPYSIGVQPASTTVIETNPPAVNLGYLGGLPGVGIPGMIGYGGFGVPGYGYGLSGLGNVGGTNVCETTPNLVGLGYPYPGQSLSSLGLAGLAPVGGSTVCESTTPGMLGLGFNLPLGRPFL